MPYFFASCLSSVFGVFHLNFVVADSSLISPQLLGRFYFELGEFCNEFVELVRMRVRLDYFLVFTLVLSCAIYIGKSGQ